MALALIFFFHLEKEETVAKSNCFSSLKSVFLLTQLAREAQILFFSLESQLEGAKKPKVTAHSFLSVMKNVFSILLESDLPITEGFARSCVHKEVAN